MHSKFLDTVPIGKSVKFKRFKEKKKTNKIGNNIILFETMENNYQEEERYFKARKRVEEIKGFYGNLIAYVVVNIGLMVLNLLTSPGYLWFFWPMLGWGIGVLFHGMKVFNYMPFFGKDWEEKKIKEFMDKEEQSKKTWE